MSVEQTEVLIVGAGQAGIAMSEHLTRANVLHLVLERARIAERWRSERWDSLAMNGPAWHDRFPHMEFPDDGPDDFPGKERVADYMVAYVEQFGGEVRTGVEVLQVTPLSGRAGFDVQTSAGQVEAQYVVAATGAFQNPVIPPLIPDTAGITQMHSTSYRNPAQLPDGAALVVGGGSSGAQIAEELLRSGRKTYLSLGPHDRPPRSYRGRDFVWWLGVLNLWDLEATPGVEHTTIAVSGAYGGHTIDFRALAQDGMTLLGRTETYADGTLTIAPDLTQNLNRGDANLLKLFDDADAYITRNGLDLPEEPEARARVADAECVTAPLASLNLAEAGITSVIWATGFSADYSWLNCTAVDEAGRPAHSRGVSAEPGVYFIGLPWQTRRGSSFIWGVWYDAGYVADHIVKQRGYVAYQAS